MELPEGLKLCLLDIGNDIGNTNAIKLLQQVLDIRETGKLDGLTLMALRAFKTTDRADLLCKQLRDKYKRNYPKQGNTQ
jgi:lysozyme family protein